MESSALVNPISIDPKLSVFRGCRNRQWLRIVSLQALHRANEQVDGS